MILDFLLKQGYGVCNYSHVIDTPYWCSLLLLPLNLCHGLKSQNNYLSSAKSKIRYWYSIQVTCWGCGGLVAFPPTTTSIHIKPFDLGHVACFINCVYQNFCWLWLCFCCFLMGGYWLFYLFSPGCGFYVGLMFKAENPSLLKGKGSYTTLKHHL